jgi:ubiquinone/menaquinone biosynthesis C-methylase UbiE
VQEALTPAQRVDVLTKNYSSEAETYERTWAPVLLRAGRFLLDRLSLEGCTALLDLGAGTGALLPEIAGRAPRAAVFGIDRSEGMIARAPGDFGRAVMDARALGFRGGSFDVVTLVFMLFHVPDPVAGLTEVRRALRAGGRVGLLTWAEEQIWPARDVWHEVLDEHGADPADPPMSQHELVDTPQKVESLLEQADFAGIETWKDVLRSEWDLDSFLDFMSGVAVSKIRLDSLDQATRKRCIAAARERLGVLEPSSFSQEAHVVGASATSPD